MGSQFPTTAFTASATDSQPPEMALDYKTLLSIFRLNDAQLYANGADDPTLLQYHQVALECLGSTDSPFFNDPSNTPRFTCIGKVEPTTGFLIATTYSATPEGSNTSIDHFSLVMGQMGTIMDPKTQETMTILTPLFQTNGIVDESNLYIAHECTYAAIDSDEDFKYWMINQEKDFYASLCYASELFMRFLSAPITDDIIKNAERWFTKSPEEISSEILRLDKRDPIDFSTDALRHEKRVSVYPAPALKQ